MKDIKEKPTAHMPRSNATGEIPKAALKKAWAEAKEKSRTMLRESTSTQGDGDYTTAQDTSSVVTDTSYSVIKQNTDFTVQQGRKIARKQIEKYRVRHAAESVEATRVHTASERGVRPQTSRVRHAARCRPAPAPWGRFAPPAGERKKSSPPRPRHEIFVV
mgnify:CR=1 FL=1